METPFSACLKQGRNMMLMACVLHNIAVIWSLKSKHEDAVPTLCHEQIELRT